jgi:hypothetical protein
MKECPTSDLSAGAASTDFGYPSRFGRNRCAFCAALQNIVLGRSLAASICHIFGRLYLPQDLWPPLSAAGPKIANLINLFDTVNNLDPARIKHAQSPVSLIYLTGPTESIESIP